MAPHRENPKARFTETRLARKEARNAKVPSLSRNVGGRVWHPVISPSQTILRFPVLTVSVFPENDIAGGGERFLVSVYTDFGVSVFPWSKGETLLRQVIETL